MRIAFESGDIVPLIHAAVEETLAALGPAGGHVSDRLAFSEVEAAALLGVKPHVLRDCRRRGEIAGVRVGRRIVYSRSALLDFLTHKRE